MGGREGGREGERDGGWECWRNKMIGVGGRERRKERGKKAGKESKQNKREGRREGGSVELVRNIPKGRGGRGSGGTADTYVVGSVKFFHSNPFPPAPLP